jgi:hypothetical protein
MLTLSQSPGQKKIQQDDGRQIRYPPPLLYAEPKNAICFKTLEKLHALLPD